MSDLPIKETRVHKGFRVTVALLPFLLPPKQLASLKPSKRNPILREVAKITNLPVGLLSYRTCVLQCLANLDCGNSIVLINFVEGPGDSSAA